MPEGIRTNRIEGNRGEIRIPSLGVVVSRMTRPVLLRRREEATLELGSFDLHAACSYFNQFLWDDDDFTKEVVIYLGKRPLRVFQFGESKMVVAQGNLRIEGVEPEWPEA